jgi:hypothetical protein
MMPRLTSACIAISSGSRNACAATSVQRGRCASRPPTGLNAMATPSAMIATTSSAKGGGVESQFRNVPRSASASVTPIQISAPDAALTAARPEETVAPVRRQAAAVPHTNSIATAAGRTRKARTGGSASE